MNYRIRKFVNVFSYIAIFIGLVLGFVAIDGKNANTEIVQKRPTLRHQSLNTDYVKLIVTYGINNEPVISLVSDGGSTGSAPADVDTNVSFTATSTDTDSDDWKLIVCSTSSAPTASSSVPSCAGGDSSLWCVSSNWASSTVSNTCAYTATSTNAESNAWWAWTCDYNIYDPKCATSSSQGSGDTGSPFNVNHKPTLTSISDDPDPVSPGATITFNATSSDADINTATDTVKLFVCKLGDATSSGCGVGGTWATSSLVVSNPSAITTPVGVGAKAYYAYVFDNHNLGALTNGTSTFFLLNSAGTGADDATIGTHAWTNPGNVKAGGCSTEVGNDSYAYADVGSGSPTHYLKATNFGFSIPTEATINGIVVETRVGVYDYTGVTQDNAARIVKGGIIGSTDRSSTTRWSGRCVTGWNTAIYISHGSPADLWEETWTPADINSSTFGFALSAKNDDTDGDSIQFDHIRITVYYTLPLTFTISNATPTVSTVLINSGSSTINLIENSTTTVTVTATVSDTNGCGDIGTTTLKFYRSEKGDACSADENDCYSSTCTQNGGSCTVGSTDTDATYTCLADLWYYADPTDTGDYEAQNWVAKVTSQDAATASHSASSTIEVNSLLAMDVADSIAYGTLGLGATSDQATSTITNTGNTEIETNVYGADMTCKSGSIGVGNQEYSTTAGFNYGSGTDLTTGSSTASVDLPQRATSTISDYIYWKLQAPATAVGGLCTGVNTFFARVGLFNQGLACSINGECASGYCTDGYCCDSVCGDVCKACGILGSEGTCTNVAAGKVFAGGSEIDASTSTNSCDLSYDYWGVVGGCSYNTRYAECDGSGTCDSDSSTNFTNATTSVTINKVITAAVSGGTSIPTIADASTSTNSCDLSYDYWGVVGGCSYNTRYAECDGSGTCDSDSSTNFTNATTSVTINKVITVAAAGGTSTPTIADASAAGNSCTGATHYYGALGSCSYNTRYAECDGSGNCDSDVSTNYTASATTSVTINKVITVAAAGGTSTPTIADASAAGNSCDLSYDYWANANECTYAKRYAECDGSGTCDSDSSTNYATTTALNVPSSNYSVAQSGGTGNPYTAGGITSDCTQTGCCSGATKTCTGGGIFGACSIVADGTYLSATENGSWDHNCDGTITYQYTTEIDACWDEPPCMTTTVAWNVACGSTAVRVNVCHGSPDCHTHWANTTSACR